MAALSPTSGVSGSLPNGMSMEQLLAMLQSSGGPPPGQQLGGGATNPNNTGVLSTPQTQGQNGTLTSQPNAPTAALAANPMLPTSAYTAQVTNALQPEFTQQNQALTEQLAGEGVLNSGAASNQLQNLVGQQSSAVSAAVAPLLEQGNAEQSATSLANAASVNNANDLGYTGGLSTYQLGQNLGNTDALANQNTQTTYDLANLGALNSTQLAQMGYSNQDYLTMLQDIYGIDTSGQAAGNTIDIGSVPTGSSAYLNGQNSVAGSAAGIGAGTVGQPTSVYGTGTNAYTGLTNDSETGGTSGQSDFNGVYGTGGSGEGTDGSGEVTDDPYYGGGGFTDYTAS